MKKLFLILLAVLCCAGVSAQKAKFGHVDYASIMPLMPGIDTAKTALAAMQQELEEEGALMSQELKQKEADYMKLVNTGASAAMLKVKEDEFNTIRACTGRSKSFRRMSSYEPDEMLSP